VWQDHREALLKGIVVTHGAINGQGYLMLDLTMFPIEGSGCIGWNGCPEGEDILSGGQFQLGSARLSVNRLVSAVVHLGGGVGHQ